MLDLYSIDNVAMSNDELVVETCLLSVAGARTRGSVVALSSFQEVKAKEAEERKKAEQVRHAFSSDRNSGT